MIEFIVLGHVPGTSIYLQFSSVLLLGAFIMSSLIAGRIIALGKSAKNNTKKLSEIAL